MDGINLGVYVVILDASSSVSMLDAEKSLAAPRLS